jgi:hypothetical protein
MHAVLHEESFDSDAGPFPILAHRLDMTRRAKKHTHHRLRPVRHRGRRPRGAVCLRRRERAERGRFRLWSRVQPAPAGRGLDEDWRRRRPLARRAAGPGRGGKPGATRLDLERPRHPPARPARSGRRGTSCTRDAVWRGLCLAPPATPTRAEPGRSPLSSSPPAQAGLGGSTNTTGTSFIADPSLWKAYEGEYQGRTRAYSRPIC